MKKYAYYNEIDKFAAAWLRELIKAGHITDGEVDERSIEDVRPEDVNRFERVHFFAGVGVWDYALTSAGWSGQVWTGSCPCQPFSAAGKGGGFDDERHLWPHLHYLIEKCGPSVVLGEQVASKDGLAWLDLVQADLEGSGYAAGAVDLCAAGVGAPHIRQRLWWVGERLASPQGGGWQGQPIRQEGWGSTGRITSDSELGGLADSGSERRGAGRNWDNRQHDGAQLDADGSHDRPGPTNGLWRDADWLFCRDGNWRPVEPGTFPLAHGDPARVGRLRGYGNAIVAPAAQAFIEAVQDTLYPAIDIRLTDLSEMTTDKGDIFA